MENIKIKNKPYLKYKPFLKKAGIVITIESLIKPIINITDTFNETLNSKIDEILGSFRLDNSGKSKHEKLSDEEIKYQIINHFNLYVKNYKNNVPFVQSKNISIKKNIVISNKKVISEKPIGKNKQGSFYKKLLGAIIKKGKKNLAKKALNNSLYIASKLYKVSSYRIIGKILGKIKCYAEIRKVTKRKITTLIPFPISKSRQKFLKVKWFLHGVKENKNKISFSHKLLKEFEKNFEKPEYIKSQRTVMNNLLIKNISNAHYRWGSR